MSADPSFHRFHQSKVTPICWPWISVLGEQGSLDELGIWVDWLRDRYGLRPHEIPTCWEHHGALVEELSALRTAWLSAFACDAPPGDPLRWHEAFDRARRRLCSWTTRSGSHAAAVCPSTPDTGRRQEQTVPCRDPRSPNRARSADRS